MSAKIVLMSFLAAAFALCGFLDVEAQEKKKRTGTLTGEVKSSKASPNGKNTLIEVLAAGEEKARVYRVMYDPAAKGPNAKVLEAVRAAKVGERAELEWIDTGEGLAITAFQVLKKAKTRDKK